MSSDFLKPVTTSHNHSHSVTTHWLASPHAHRTGGTATQSKDSGYSII